MRNIHNINHALSFGIEERNGFWVMKYPDPFDSHEVHTISISINESDKGQSQDGPAVYYAGERLQKVIAYLNDQIQVYPYKWPFESESLDAFSYDFSLNLSTYHIEISILAFEAVDERLGIPEEEPEIQEMTYFAAGGAYAKIEILLDRPKPVSSLYITPFTTYPMEVMSITYEEDTETFHPKKELVPIEDVKFYQRPNGDVVGTKGIASTNTIRMEFAAITAKRFILILRQKNYTKHTYLVREKAINDQDLWDKISQRQSQYRMGEVSSSAENQITSWTGWDIYLDQLEKHKEEIKEWEKQMKAFTEERQVYDQGVTHYEQALNEHRQEVKRLEDQYRQKMQDYEARLDSYNKSRQRHERNLREWEKKWG